MQNRTNTQPSSTIVQSSATFRKNARASATTPSFAVFADQLRTTLVKVAEGDLVEWAQLHLGLETLPLSTSEFALAESRLKNARRYLESGEAGAAKFEIRLLLGQVQPASPPVDVLA